MPQSEETVTNQGELVMSKGRTELTNEDKYILDKMKEFLTDGIKDLLERGVRDANIEIELMWHIKNLLKGE